MLKFLNETYFSIVHEKNIQQFTKKNKTIILTYLRIRTPVTTTLKNPNMTRMTIKLEDIAASAVVIG